MRKKGIVINRSRARQNLHMQMLWSQQLRHNWKGPQGPVSILFCRPFAKFVRIDCLNFHRRCINPSTTSCLIYFWGLGKGINLGWRERVHWCFYAPVITTRFISRKLNVKVKIKYQYFFNMVVILTWKYPVLVNQIILILCQ